ncbi:MAG TPA: hypothetical protein VFG83_19680 [Kofleriaceae bacterium]|nr:hypothetical protein [Kofleriaceae bacterium]
MAITALAMMAVACADNRTPYPTAADAAAPSCVPDLDGALEAGELPITLGQVGYWVSPAGETRTVDIAGTVDGRGVRTWDFAADTAGDDWTSSTISSVGEQWYAAEFPASAFVIREGDTDRIYRKDDSALWLLGIASHDPDPAAGKTLLAYDEPVAVVRFPIVPDRAYIATGQVSLGTLNGLPYNGEDRYEIETRGGGELALPGARFSQVHRVDTRVTVTPAAGGAGTTYRQTSYFFECFGEIVRATSEPGEPEADFTNAASVRRLALLRPDERIEP